MTLYYKLSLLNESQAEQSLKVTGSYWRKTETEEKPTEVK